MPESVRLRVKKGDVEIEVEGPPDAIPSLLEAATRLISRVEVAPQAEEGGAEAEVEAYPHIVVKKGDSCADVLEKLFSTEWGSRPRTLREVIDALTVNGVYFPKSTVAVSLMRLVKRGALRRLKSEAGFLYVRAAPVHSE